LICTILGLRGHVLSILIKQKIAECDFQARTVPHFENMKRFSSQL
jgi:hypothetical protein